MRKVKVLLADSSTFTRILLSNALDSLGFDVVAVAKDGKEAMEMFAEHEPDITLVDVALEKPDGISVVRILTETNASAVIALLIPENMDDPDIIVEAVRVGAKSYIRKPTSGEDMEQRLAKLLKARGGE